MLSGNIASREGTVSGKLLHSIKVSEGYFEMCPFCLWSEAVIVLQSQPVFTIRITEAINIAGPIEVEVDRTIHSVLDDLPPSVHIAVHLEWFTTTWVMVYTSEVMQPSAYLLTVRREMIGAPFTYEMKDNSLYVATTFLCFMMSTCTLTDLSVTAGHYSKCYHQHKMIWKGVMTI